MRDSHRNAKAPRGKHWCYMHNDGKGAYVPKSEFNKNRDRPHGLDSRCRACMKEYRKQYEANNRERNKQTKTLRIAKHVHALVKAEAERRGATLEELTIRAFKFYLQYGCRAGTCNNPATPSGLCEKHGVKLRRIV